MDFPETTERFIAYFDIMGFKDMMYRDGHNKVAEIMDSISKFVAKLKEDNTMILKKLGGGKGNGSGVGIILPVLFSDSILFISQSNTVSDVFYTAIYSSSFIYTMLKEQIPLKGALAYGKFTADFKNSKFFGRPLVDAYLLAEETCFYGALLHHSFETFVSENGGVWPTGFINRSSVPLKKGEVTHYFVEWRHGEEQWESILQPFYTSVSGSTRKYVDNTFKVYSENPYQRRDECDKEPETK